MALWRFHLSPKPGQADPLGRQTLQAFRDFGIASVQAVATARLFTIELPGSAQDEGGTVQRIADALLADPVTEDCRICAAGQDSAEPQGVLPIEVHFKAGVMDNVANSTLLALKDMGIEACSVRTARRFELRPAPSDADLRSIPKLLGNGCIEDVVPGGKPIGPPPTPPACEFKLRHLAIRDLDGPDLERLSREGHLFLSREEMEAVRDHFRTAGRDPTDLELETIAQTWSEHCVHKTLKAAITYQGAPFPKMRGALQPLDVNRSTQAGCTTVVREYANLLGDTIARATDELIRAGRGPRCLSVFKDNAGIIAFDDAYGVAFKVETHNHPSAIEPYGGAATGIGGCIRDVLGCGLGAKPIANTDVFCVAPPDWPVDAVPTGIIHPKRVLEGIVAGVRDYGNRMGIPTVNGAVHFDPRYLGNPLVYCGCVGLIPRDRIDKAARPGDVIVLMGGRTGRDGIHGATFSSSELTDTHADEFAHAVQIGNPIEEKKILDVLLQARDHADGCLYSAVTDCGAGGLSSAVGEMAAEIGAVVDLETVPLKYAGLRYDEIWISEAQERMVFAVPPDRVHELEALAADEDVEATAIGRFTDSGRLIVRYNGTEVGNLDMHLLHHGLPKATRRAEWRPDDTPSPTVKRQWSTDNPESCVAELRRRLGDPGTASKHWIIRQYDHEVQGGSVVKPLVGPCDGPSDAAVLRPRLDSDRGIALGCGMAPHLADRDPYWMAVAAIDEALRNVVCVGGNPDQTAILDNFCWPRVDDPRNLGALVRACQACHDVAMTYGLPFISGKDSLNNEFALDPADVETIRAIIHEQPQRAHEQAQRAGPSSARSAAPGKASALSTQHSALPAIRNGRLAIPYTLLISAVSLIDDVNRCITAAPNPTKGEDNEARLFYVGAQAADWQAADLPTLARLHGAVAGLIHTGAVVAAHDCSDGGVMVAVAEMALAGGLDTHFTLAPSGPIADPFAEPVCGYVLQVTNVRAAEASVADIPGVTLFEIATLAAPAAEPEFRIVKPRSAAHGPGSPLAILAAAKLADLRQAWTSPLDW